MTDKISVILPAHNEEGNIGIMVKNLHEIIGSELHEIVIVNDNSTDKTKEVAQDLMKTYEKIKLINRRPPNGVGRALREGYENISSDTDWVLTLDADFVNNKQDIKRIVDARSEDDDGLVGSRFCKGGKLVRYPFLKKVANRLFHSLIWTTLRINKADLTNNFRLYRPEIFRKIKWQSNDFGINAETGIYPQVLGYRVKEVPVSWIERTSGSSDFVVFKLAPSYLKVLWRALFQKKSLLNKP